MIAGMASTGMGEGDALGRVTAGSSARDSVNCAPMPVGDVGRDLSPVDLRDGVRPEAAATPRGGSGQPSVGQGPPARPPEIGSGAAARAEVLRSRVWLSRAVEPGGTEVYRYVGQVG